MKIRWLSSLLFLGLVTVASPLANTKQKTSLSTSVPPETLLLTQAGRIVEGCSSGDPITFIAASPYGY
jgi:hypothetical protein